MRASTVACTRYHEKAPLASSSTLADLPVSMRKRSVKLFAMSPAWCRCRRSAFTSGKLEYSTAPSPLLHTSHSSDPANVRHNRHQATT